MAETSRVLVRLPNWLGDIVMAMPAVAAIARHGGRDVTVALPAAFAPLGASMPGVRDVVALQGRGVRGLSSHAAAMAAGGFDVAILLTNSFVSALAAARAGVAERWGYSRDFRRPLLTRPIARRAARPASRHHSAYYLALVEALGMEASAAFTPLRAPERGRGRALDLLREAGWREGAEPLVALAPGAAYGAAKRWPAARAAEAIAILQEQGTKVVLVGAGADRPEARAIRSALAGRFSRPPALVDLVGRTDLETLMGVLGYCGVAISNDSGAMHVASAVGTPVVGVFGPTDERATHPLGAHTIVRHDVWCRPCLLRDCPIDHGCLEAVSGGSVARAAMAWLERKGERA